MPTKNYCFHADAPTDNLTEVSDQMHSAHRYRNRLCELERTRREASEATIRRLSPEYSVLAEAYDVAEAAVEAAYLDLKKERAKARSRLDPTDVQKTAISEAKTARKLAAEAVKKIKIEVYATLKELQSPYMAQAEAAVPVDPDMKPGTRKQKVRAEYLARLAAVELDAGQLAYARDQKQARADCGCHWGTYLIVEDAAKDFGKGPPPAFKTWTGDGTIGVQLMGGLSVEDACDGDDTRFRIALSNEEELATIGHSHSKHAKGTVRLRIGSHADRSPIWTEFSVTFHRSLPRLGDIRWAYLHRRRIARGDEWQLRMTINEPTTEAPSGDGVCK